MKQSLINLTKQLIATPSVSDNTEQLNAVFDLVEKEFAGLPLIVKKFRKNNKPSLVITLADTKTPDIFLNGHLDVVAATSDQFRPEIRNDLLYGRGAYDMKAACAVMIDLMKDLARTNIARDRVGLMLVPDEEVGGFSGTGFLVEEGYQPEEFFVAGEGTNFEIVRESKGALWIKLAAKGKASHGAYPWKGKNAVLPLISSLARIANFYPQPEEELWHTTCSITQVNAGKSNNIVPDYSEATLDFRFTSEESTKEIIRNVRSLLDPGVALEIILDQPPHNTHEKDQKLLHLQQVVRLVTGKTTKMGRRHGISDTKFLAKSGIPACSFGPKGNNLHQKNEYVSLDSLTDYYQILKKLVLQ